MGGLVENCRVGLNNRIQCIVNLLEKGTLNVKEVKLYFLKMESFIWPLLKLIKSIERLVARGYHRKLQVSFLSRRIKVKCSDA